jgi:hypothetical protein
VESKGFKRDVERFTCRIFWKGPSKSARIDEGQDLIRKRLRRCR